MRSYSNPVIQPQPQLSPFASTRGVAGIATPTGARPMASYAAPPMTYAAPPMNTYDGMAQQAMNTYDATRGSSTPAMTYASPPMSSARQISSPQVRPASVQRAQSPMSSSRRAFQVDAATPQFAQVYASSPPASLTYASGPRLQEQLIVEPNGQIDRMVYAGAPMMTYAGAPVQEVVEIIKDEAEANALRAELQECVALVQDYQRKNAELVNSKNGLEISLSACEARNAELRHENEGQRAEINMLLRRNEELQSLNLSLQERVRDLEANQQQAQQQQSHHKPAHAAAPAPHGDSDDDKVENLIRDFVRAHPDFPIEVERTKPLWYQFTGPIHRKMNFKVQGKQILAHVGGGYSEANKWLTDQREEFLKAEGIMLEEERQNSPSAGVKGRQLGSRTSAKRGSSQNRNSVKGR